MRAVYGDEWAAWAVKLYNAYDDLFSAFGVGGRYTSPAQWRNAGRFDLVERDRWATAHPCGGERRNLRGGLVVRHLDSYVAALQGQPQVQWLREGIVPGQPAKGFEALMRWMRRNCWGTGRLAAFEWAEFAGKVLGLPVKAGNGCLWESSGPRESLERIYNGGGPAPSQGWLDGMAVECREYVAGQGTRLEWWDFETVICDFNVMRKGRYYPGKHLAMISAEIREVHGEIGRAAQDAFDTVIPEPWRGIKPGADKVMAAHYASHGKIPVPV
jgi:hypothetical protein